MRSLGRPLDLHLENAARTRDYVIPSYRNAWYVSNEATPQRFSLELRFVNSPVQYVCGDHVSMGVRPSPSYLVLPVEGAVHLEFPTRSLNGVHG